MLPFSTTAQELSNPWRLSFEKKGIRVESQSSTNSSLLTFRATTQIPASIPRILSVFYDATHSTEWMQDTKEMRILEEGHSQEDNLCIYSRVKVSGGSDRDFIMRLTSSFYPEKQEMVVSFTSRPNEPCPLFPPVPGVIRMPRIEGAWTLRYKGPLTEVEYKVYAEPGGLIQRWFGWIVNAVSKDIPYNTLAALRKQVSRADRGDQKLEQKILKSSEYQRFIVSLNIPQ